MPAWFLPAVKLILPHVGNIVAAATPVFTRHRETADRNTVAQQIAELQTAATENAALTKDLAEQVQATIKALEQSAATMQERARRLYAFSMVAVLVSLAALLIAIVALVEN